MYGAAVNGWLSCSKDVVFAYTHMPGCVIPAEIVLCNMLLFMQLSDIRFTSIKF